LDGCFARRDLVEGWNSNHVARHHARMGVRNKLSPAKSTIERSLLSQKGFFPATAPLIYADYLDFQGGLFYSSPGASEDESKWTRLADDAHKSLAAAIFGL
jgi:hypothetical protein